MLVYALCHPTLAIDLPIPHIIPPVFLNPPRMASSGVNVRIPALPRTISTSVAYSHAQVLRYAALVTGVGYGYYHQASITTNQKLARIDQEQASLIAKAKSEWVKKTTPKEPKEGAGELAFFSEGNDVWELHCCQVISAGSGVCRPLGVFGGTSK